MPRKSPVRITNPSASRLPAGREVRVLPGVEPVEPVPRPRVGELIRPAPVSA